MSIKNYEESAKIIESVDDENVRKLMGSLVALVLTDQELDLISSDEELDLKMLMEIMKAFFSKEHLLRAACTGDWSEIEWWPPED